MNPDLRTGIRYAEAETRGRIRAWKKKLAQNYTLFDAAYTALQGNNRQLALDMVRASRS